jgi:ATP-binding cassette subfamily B protein
MATFRDLLKPFYPLRAIAIFSILMSGLFEIVDLVVPYAIGQILNVLSNQPLDRPIQELVHTLQPMTGINHIKGLSLGILLGIIAIVTVIKAPIQPWLGVWFHWDIALRTRRDYLKQIFSKILTLPLSFYDENNPGRIANRIAKGIENLTWSYPEVAGQLLPKLIRVAGIAVAIALIDGRIAIAFLVSFCLILWYSLNHLRSLMKQEELLDKHMENTQSRTSEIITNIKTVKAFATEAQELHLQSQRLDRECTYVIHRIHLGYVTLIVRQKTMVQLSIFAVLVGSLLGTLAGNISLGHFVTTLTLSSMAYAELEPISQLSEVFARRYSSMARLYELASLPTGQDSLTINLSDRLANSYRFSGKIDFQQVSFGYNPDRLVLNDFDLMIHPCQTVALVGRSGSGKSTLIKLLFRYFEPNSGKILIDGQDIRDLAVDQYRRRLAIVHQEVDIFNGTLKDNLTYGNPSVSFAQVEEACRIAKVDDVIRELPQGYYTIVGERGVRLSGGQRQRLGIARALIVNPDVLVFDEATSSLDYESERSIQLAMKSILGTRTTLIIAHRLSTVREADVIVVLDRGRIVEVGNHGQLLEQDGLYHRLHSLQETGELLV